eukprot:gnl/TRDRNA2_/TRDRNA2_127918_c0_seq1.p1 gnl/TRDRNA2_/TRDRNA2_127918_c0~~gnl/TRDRNA2_/TRDRNA2_127918_c0_seq1.p1  ORF type:complete len:467 (+),score=89.94 gnl/TRDRNA2_/TRDRNA2_127918_c0_seq1:122-1522(+)
MGEAASSACKNCSADGCRERIHVAVAQLPDAAVDGQPCNCCETACCRGHVLPTRGRFEASPPRSPESPTGLWLAAVRGPDAPLRAGPWTGGNASRLPEALTAPVLNRPPPPVKDEVELQWHAREEISFRQIEDVVLQAKEDFKQLALNEGAKHAREEADRKMEEEARQRTKSAQGWLQLRRTTPDDEPQEGIGREANYEADRELCDLRTKEYFARQASKDTECWAEEVVDRQLPDRSADAEEPGLKDEDDDTEWLCYPVRASTELVKQSAATHDEDESRSAGANREELVVAEIQLLLEDAQLERIIRGRGYKAEQEWRGSGTTMAEILSDARALQPSLTARIAGAHEFIKGYIRLGVLIGPPIDDNLAACEAPSCSENWSAREAEMCPPPPPIDQHMSAEVKSFLVARDLEVMKVSDLRSHIDSACRPLSDTDFLGLIEYVRSQLTAAMQDRVDAASAVADHAVFE